jgi:murein DD-endopeptidase MepM/ murein hydrolase activator NlpD
MVNNRQPVLRQRNATVLPVTLSTFGASCLLVTLLWLGLTPSIKSAVTRDNIAIDNTTSNATASLVVPATPVVTEWQTFALVNGDSLNNFLLAHHATRADIQSIMAIPAVRHNARKLPAGGAVELKLNDQSELVGLKLPINHDETLTLSRTQTGFKSDLYTLPVQMKDSVASGTVGFSLASALRHAGLPSSYADDLSQIFGWKLNLAKDLHHGSKFNIVYQTEEQGGRKVDTGKILAAEITTNGKTYTALGFTNSHGQMNYYTPDGQSMQGGFLRAPLHYLRISSPFSLDRMQPILHIRRPHEGADLAAPSGTAVHAVGDGVVQFIGRDSGYGNLVIIDHGHGISTRYAHLARFASDIHVGTHLDEGETLGFVGSTGLATGPHLHFEYRINNKAVNPMTVALPSSSSIPGPYRREFMVEAKVLEKELDGFQTDRLA